MAAGDETQAVSRASQDDSSAPIWRRIPKAGLIAAGVVAAAAVVLIVLAATGVLFPKEQLTDDQITQAVQQRDWSAEHLTDSEWGVNDGYSVESMEVLSNEEEPGLSVDDPEMRCARVQIVLSNPSFRVTVVSGEYFRRAADDSWEHFNTVIESVSPEPIGPIDDERLIASVPTFLRSVDDSDKGKHDDDLLDLYGEGASFEVVSNDTGAQGGSAQIKLSRDAGLYTCTGTLTVDFSFGGGDWNQASCSVDEAAYQKDYSAMIGEHMGTFDHVEAISGSERHCFGGRANPLKINVKSFDPVGNTITADLTFTVHNHDDPDNNVESSEGDSVYTVNDVIVSLDFSGWSKKVYDKDDVAGLDYMKVYLSMSEDSSVAEVHIEQSSSTRNRNGQYDDYYTIDFSK